MIAKDLDSYYESIVVYKMIAAARGTQAFQEVGFWRMY